MADTFTISVPRLHTERLTLREYRVADFELFADHLSDPESSAFLGSADRQAAWRIFNSHAGLWLLNQAGWWSIEDRQTGSHWNALGEAVSGPLKGTRLEAVPGGVHFAFAWLAFRPDSEIHGAAKAP